MGNLEELGRRYLAVCVSQDEGEEMDPRLFQIGHNWVNVRAAQGALDTGGEFDPEAIGSKVDEVGDGLDQFQTVET